MYALYALVEFDVCMFMYVYACICVLLGFVGEDSKAKPQSQTPVRGDAT
jgi:hypothetical protein